MMFCQEDCCAPSAMTIVLTAVAANANDSNMVNEFKAIYYYVQWVTRMIFLRKRDKFQCILDFLEFDVLLASQLKLK